mmetsp:Transcript_14013/g.30318  ORF Transcript_14013/g.30318 Transcript_14013/m.30318 type:complete len:257 (-) Transcript_14013:1021-1791(-)|eukprot:CAMPEP_0202904322 /NCGR_PEP_ID=MMETSP1392-20130828/28807_1 /ASSEMBLY_ACC=CAM_ASM_000868 /TAXON_ID=225041 /ORGANISM="Chlamydomonas chlamydogama, Strain SAG 11-48b" /LENGTH=256 /DNA_ID=CAMNT_0049591887 /DNA_START=192 /DNA_END=962 /DNA_ORIENTATION=-
MKSSTLSVDDLLKEFDDLPLANANNRQHHARPSPSASTGHLQPSQNREQTVQRTEVPDNSHMGRGSLPGFSSSSPAQPRSLQKDIAQSHSASSSLKQRPTCAARSSLELLLDDFNDLPGNNSTRTTPPTKPAVVQAQARPSIGGAKCMGIFLGGCSLPRGRNGSVVGTVMCCDSLRCTKCDFKVAWFDHKTWDPAVDYLFFRNNYPTESKLSPMLRQAPGSCAYCCQCSWHSTVSENRVDFGSELRWVCGGHNVGP